MRVMALPIFILIVIFAVMVIFAVINKFGWKSLLILPALFLIMLAAVGVAVGVLLHPRHYVEVKQDMISSWNLPQESITTSSIWTEGIENEFEADVYPSKEHAAQALAQQVAPLLSTVTPNQTLPTSIEVYGRDVSIQILNVFADTLREKTGLSDLLVQPIQPEQTLHSDSNGVVVVMDIAKWKPTLPFVPQPVPYEMSLQTGVGTLRIHIEGADGQPVITRSVEVVEKPWVQNLGSLLNENPNAHLAVARSNETCTDQLEARQQAMNSALSVVQDAIAQGTPSNSINHSAINAISEQDLTAHQLILDQFSQSFNSATSRIWRYAILLDLDSNKLTSLFQNKLRTTRTMRVSVQKRWVTQFSSLAGLALVVLILYIFLNAATKGYYTWSLRIAAAILIGVFIIAVFNFV